MKRLLIATFSGLLAAAALLVLCSTSPRALACAPSASARVYSNTFAHCDSFTTYGACVAKCTELGDERLKFQATSYVITHTLPRYEFTTTQGVTISQWWVNPPWLAQYCAGNEFNFWGYGPWFYGDIIYDGPPGYWYYFAGVTFTLPYPDCLRYHVSADWAFERESSDGAYGYQRVGCASEDGDCWLYDEEVDAVGFVATNNAGTGECGDMLKRQDGGLSVFSIRCSYGTLSGTWLITHTSRIITETEPLTVCTVLQEVSFDEVIDGISAREIAKSDRYPYGLEPFRNGWYSTIQNPHWLQVRYELITGTEYHVVQFFNEKGFVPPFEEPDSGICRYPSDDFSACDKYTLENMSAYGHGLLNPGWILYPLCVWYHTILILLGYIGYLWCMFVTFIIRIVNGLFEFLWYIFADLMLLLNAFGALIVAIPQQLGAFLALLLSEISSWLRGAQENLSAWLSSWAGLGNFLRSVIDAIIAWLRGAQENISAWLSSWAGLGNFLRSVIDAIIAWLRGAQETIAALLKLIESLFQLMISMLTRTLSRVVSMITSLVNMVTYLFELLSGMLSMFSAGLSVSDPVELHMDGMPGFIEGIEVFEDFADRLYLDRLVSVIIGMVCFALIWWTLFEIKDIVSKVMDI